MKKKIIGYITLLGLLSLLLVSCEESKLEPTATETGTGYYPLQLNDSLVYKINTTRHFELVPDEYDEFYQLEVITEAKETQEGVNYKLEIYKAPSLDDPWVIDSIFTIRSSLARLVKVESNTPYIKLVFPVENNKEWDVNAYNTEDKQTCFYKNVNQLYTIDEKTYPNTVHVIHTMDSSTINKDVRYDIYASGIGILQSRREIYDYVNRFFLENGQPNPAYGIDSIIGGVYYNKKLISH